MRIAIDGRMAETRGGIGTYTRELITQLAKADHKNQYFVITNKQTKQNIGIEADNFSIVKSSITRKHYFIKDLWNLFFLPFLLKANNIDIYLTLVMFFQFLKEILKWWLPCTI
jgi:hypothetical protein